jgi:hypothetical protein
MQQKKKSLAHAAPSGLTAPNKCVQVMTHAWSCTCICITNYFFSLTDKGSFSLCDLTATSNDDDYAPRCSNRTVRLLSQLNHLALSAFPGSHLLDRVL